MNFIQDIFSSQPPIVGDLASTLAVLSAMITPAVLILACSSLILATSQRLGRILDRSRLISDQYEKIALSNHEDVSHQERCTLLFHLLTQATRRARLLQTAMTALYLTLGMFVATSFTIGVASAIGIRYAWIPILFGLGGALILLVSGVILIVESRIAARAVNEEMNFYMRVSSRCEHPHYADLAPARIHPPHTSSPVEK